MGAGKILWEIEVERIFDEYLAENITRGEAIEDLIGKGFDRDEAETQIDECEL